ncbi:tryptophan synthase subunit alpha [Saccharicrinis sp. FJH62]|uniref:tryptophan synthase subunit alpha n=1 Tax=Saccharicrinis sp. FJH62 TaxID=3344657 RepID=UPI0035D4F259
MNRIDILFQKKKNNILSVFFTAGHPNLNDTVTIIKKLEESGADMIEIGMPFSDPLADGPVIQKTSEQALKNGMTLDRLFEQLKDIRDKVKIPLLLMGYLNPVFKYGIERFAKKCHEVGIDGLILPDLPASEYLRDFKKLFEANNLHNIFLITPQTSSDRVKQIDELTGGFIYMVSSASTTGTKTGIDEIQTAYFERIKDLKLNSPRLIGFGIKDKSTFENACNYANGAIIGSAFVKSLELSRDINSNIERFIKSVINK